MGLFLLYLLISSMMLFDQERCASNAHLAFYYALQTSMIQGEEGAIDSFPSPH
jgi:hypothetical protein